MKYKNQPNFIPQPKLNMAEISKNNGVRRNRPESLASLSGNEQQRVQGRDTLRQILQRRESSKLAGEEEGLRHNRLRKSKSTQEMEPLSIVLKDANALNECESQNSPSEEGNHEDIDRESEKATPTRRHDNDQAK